jgi:PAS domain S-box-containing protein
MRQLEESERTYRTLAENFPDGAVGVYDSELRYDLVGGVMWEYMETDAEDLEGKTIHEVFPERIVDDIEPVFRAAVDSGETSDVLTEFEDRTLRVWAKPLRDADGEIFAGMSFAQDVTDQVEHERTLDLLDHTEQIADVGSWEIEMETQEVYWSDNLFELLGLDAEDEPPLEEALDVYVEEDRSKVEEAIETAISTKESFTVEARFERPDGEIRWLQIKGAPTIDDGDVTKIRGAVQDITVRKEREARLQATNSRLEALFNRSPDMIDVLDPDGTILDVNKRFCEELGYQEEEVIGRSIWDIDTAVDEAEVSSLLSDLAPEERRKFGGSYRRKDGSTFPVEVHLLRLDLDGKDRFLAISRDITERKKREQIRERHNEQLQRFASVVSHDLRNPLNVAQGKLAMAREEYESTHLEAVEAAIERSHALIDDLLTLAREGNRVSDIESVDLATFCERCWENVLTTGATLEVVTDRTIEADRSRLQQILENLYQNAIEHGGDDVTVTVGDLPDGFYVEDDGPGIPEEKREEVFDMGYSTAMDGTGFGLSIVKRIAEAHGWEVAVTSSAAGGARIEISGV